MSESSDEMIAQIFDPSNARHISSLESNFRAIGQVTAAWSSFEHVVNLVIWAMAGVDEQRGMCITAQFPTIQTRARALLSLYRVLGGSEEIAKTVNKFFVNDVEPVAQERNRIIHDPMAINQNGCAVRIRITADKRLYAKVREDPIKDAEDACAAIARLLTEFRKHQVAMYDSLPSLPKISLVQR